jgi:hypothetical protein
MRYAVPKPDSNDLLFLRRLIKVFEDQERAETSSQILKSFFRLSRRALACTNHLINMIAVGSIQCSNSSEGVGSQSQPLTPYLQNVTALFTGSVGLVLRRVNEVSDFTP